MRKERGERGGLREEGETEGTERESEGGREKREGLREAGEGNSGSRETEGGGRKDKREGD